ncbi:uncharacterized protein At4g28440-like [Rosa rugosa]|uniref:uncharacterized protein At4g28440-like n=1 Tax=Rosa rugosa TaxID=74645 RepID=UPI002B4135E4|nr:uncharacterized protein At4g28440-like [Rosa rugosa]
MRDATKVEKLRPDTSDVTLTVKVVSTKIVGMQFADCLVGDETGVIVFRATNDQVDLMKEGLTVTLQNAKVDMFNDSMRLVVDESGSVQVAEPAGFTVKEDSNLSLIQASIGNVNKDQKQEGPRELEVYEQGMPKTELCLNWQDSGYCRCKDHCKFAHGMEELRPVNRHPLYKTKVCQYWLAGEPCGFGHRCHFRHTLT